VNQKRSARRSGVQAKASPSRWRHPRPFPSVSGVLGGGEIGRAQNCNMGRKPELIRDRVAPAIKSCLNFRGNEIPNSKNRIRTGPDLKIMTWGET